MDPIDDRNRAFFSDGGVVAEYEADSGLTPPERVLFDHYVRPGAAVLDLGVGAGRTTEVLVPIAGRYVGIDYAPEMASACAARFPAADIREGDAADLSAFDDGTFDVAVFSFNGLDCLHPLEQRRRCLAEMHRVLRPGGVAILSCHNVHALVRPITSSQGPTGQLSRMAKQGYAAALILSRTAAGGVFVRGAGYVRDSATPLVLYMCSRRRFADEAHDAGFRVLEILGSDHPAPPSTLRSAWFYYALRRS